MKQILFAFAILIGMGGHCLQGGHAPKPFIQKNDDAAEKSKHHSKKKPCCIKKDLCCSCKHVISSKEINKGKGVVIDKSGVWCLDGDAVFDPKPSKYSPPDPRAVQAAITVKPGVSNVIIDLGNYRLSQGRSGSVDQVPYVIGILVPDPDPSNTTPGFFGTESIYIQGDQAIIDGFSMFGVRVFAHTYDIRMENITVKNCGQLVSLQPFPSYTPHSSTDTSTFPFNVNAMSVGGIVIGESLFNGLGATFFTENVPPSISGIPAPRVEQVELTNVSCLNNYYNGIVVTYTTDVAIEKCHFDGTYVNQGPVPELFYTSPAVGGYFVGGGGNNSPDGKGVINLSVKDTTFNDTQVRGDFTTEVNYFGEAFSTGGVIIYDGLNGYWDNCQFNGSSMTFASAGFFNFTVGCIASGAEGYIFNNCQFNNTHSTCSVMGFHSSGSGLTAGSSGMVLTNCQACDAQVINNLLTTQTAPASSFQAIGFFYAFGQNPTFENCVATDIIINGPVDASSFAAGFSLLDITEISLLKEKNANLIGCSAQNCLAKNGGFTAGFYLKTGFFPGDPVSSTQSIAFEQCVAAGSTASIPKPWDGSTVYSTGDLVISGGIIYESLQNLNENNMPPLAGFWAVQNAIGLVGVPSTGFGFALLGADPSAQSFPWSLTNCKALHNKGIDFDPISNTYSAGFYLLSAQEASLVGCEAIDNIYGVFLQQSDSCSIRNCHADNNVDLNTGVGGGFVDVGTTGTLNSPSQSTSLFELNHAYNNGDGVTQVGANGNYNVFVDVNATVPLPTLQGKFSTSSYNYFNPAFYTPVHNVAIIK